MTSIIKVDQIQTAAGAVPTANSLGLNTTGSVLQVRHHTVDPGTSSTSSLTLVATGLTIDITPRDVNSSFLIMMSMNECYMPASASSHAMGFAIARNGSRLSDTDQATINYSNSASAGATYFNYNLHSYDSPNTTSTITYSGMLKSRYGTTVYWNGDNTPAFLTVIEIAG